MIPQLDQDVSALLEVMRAAGTAQPYELPLHEARAQMRAALAGKGEPIELHSVSDLSLSAPAGPLALRLYRPREGVLPVALFLHGGGWALNDLDTHDRVCRRIAKRCGWLVAALDFRRAPEHRHPAALEDALLAYRWLKDNGARLEIDPSTVALVGESSGGTTAACLSLLLRDLGAPLPAVQVLVYPILDAYARWPSYERMGSGYTLDSDFLRWAFEQYVPAGHDVSDPYLIPMSAEDLSGLSPALIVTAEFDPLRDEGMAYARRLAESGVPVEHLHAPDQAHSFLLFDRAVPRAGALIDELADRLSAYAAPLGAAASVGSAA